MLLILCVLASARSFFLRLTYTRISSMEFRKTSATSTTTMNASVRALLFLTDLFQVAQLKRDHLCLVLTVNLKTSRRDLLGLPLHLGGSRTTSHLVVKEK